MAKEVAPALPPRISVENLIRPWRPAELDVAVRAVLETRWAREIAEAVPFDLPELIKYTVEKYVPPGAEPYYREMLAVTKASSARESRIGADVMDRLARCATIEEAKAVMDSSIERYIGIARYVGLVTALGPVGEMIPAPPEGIPSVSGPYRPGHYYTDAEVAQSLFSEPVASGAGPLFFTRDNHAWEVTFTGRGIKASVTVWFLWEFIFCILFRWWIPIRVYVGEGDRLICRFRTSIDYRYVVAYAAQPAWSSKHRVEVTVAKIV